MKTIIFNLSLLLFTGVTPLSSIAIAAEEIPISAIEAFRVEVWHCLNEESPDCLRNWLADRPWFHSQDFGCRDSHPFTREDFIACLDYPDRNRVYRKSFSLSLKEVLKRCFQSDATWDPVNRYLTREYIDTPNRNTACLIEKGKDGKLRIQSLSGSGC